MHRIILVLAAFLATTAAHAETGIASHYGPGFDGRRTASGARFNQFRVSCAHKTIRLGTWVRVTDLRTHRVIACIVTDRGPFIRGRVIDLSTAAARQLGMLSRGLAHVSVEAIR